MIRLGLLILITIPSLLLTPSLLAQETEVDHFLLCKNRGHVRSVYVEKMDSGCRTQYTKRGLRESVGSGLHMNTCVQFLNNIKTNLEGANWSCRAAARAVILTET